MKKLILVLSLFSSMVANANSYDGHIHPTVPVGVPERFHNCIALKLPRGYCLHKYLSQETPAEQPQQDQQSKTHYSEVQEAAPEAMN